MRTKLSTTSPSPASHGASSQKRRQEDPDAYEAYDNSSYYQTKGTCVSDAISIKSGYTIGSGSIFSSQVSNDGSVFPPASCVSPYVPRDVDHSIFMGVKFKDAIAAYPHRDLLFLAGIQGRDKEPAIKFGLLCSTPTNKRYWDTPEKTSLWSSTREKLVSFYNEVFDGEHATVSNLIMGDGDSERGVHNVTNHFILYAGTAENPTIIAAVSYGCDYDVHQRDEWGSPLATKVFIHYIATRQGRFLKNPGGGDDETFQGRGIGAFMLGFVDNYVRIDKPFIPFYLMVNSKADNDKKAPKGFLRHGYHKAKPKDVTDIKPLFFSMEACQSKNERKAQHLMVSHVPAWLCGPAKLSKLALFPPLSIWEDYASIDDNIEDDGKTIQTMATCLDEYTCYFKMLFKSQEERDEMIRMALSNFPTLFGKSNLAIQLDQLVSISNDTCKSLPLDTDDDEGVTSPDLAMLQKLFPEQETGLTFEATKGSPIICAGGFFEMMQETVFKGTNVPAIEICSLFVGMILKISYLSVSHKFWTAQSENTKFLYSKMVPQDPSADVTPVTPADFTTYADLLRSGKLAKRAGSFELLLLRALTGVELVELQGSTLEKKTKIRETLEKREWTRTARMIFLSITRPQICGSWKAALDCVWYDQPQSVGYCEVFKRGYVPAGKA